MQTVKHTHTCRHFHETEQTVCNALSYAGECIENGSLKKFEQWLEINNSGGERIWWEITFCVESIESGRIAADETAHTNGGGSGEVVA